MSELVKVTRWARLDDFNPLSVLQIKAYLTAKKIPLPKHRSDRDDEGNRKDTTNNESLLGLLQEGKPGHGDLVIQGVLDSRHISKAKAYLSDTYVHRDGRFHAQFSFRPKQRLAAAAPAIMQMPKGKSDEKIMQEASEALLSSVVADPGWTLFSCDWESLHPNLIAYFANDPQYARQARLGDHATVMSHFLYLSGRVPAPVDYTKSDDEIRAELDELKKKHPAEYKVCKIGNLGYKYLQGVNNMAKSIGLSIENTKKIRDAIDAASPRVMEWKWKTLERAHHDGSLVSPFGLPWYCFDVFQTKGGKVQVNSRESNALYPNGVPKLGSEAPEAAAFMPLSTESGMLRECLVDLGEHPEHEKSFVMLVPEHDKIIGQALDSELDRVLQHIVIPSMNRKWPELGGLQVGVDVEVGKGLGSMERWKGATPATH